MNYKDAVKVFVTIIIILNRAESELVARISQRDEPTVGKDHRLYCEVGNPNSAVSRQYKWKINNKKITNYERFVLNDRSLTIKNIKKRDKNMVIQCQVDQSEFSTIVVLNPRYGPFSVRINPEQSQYDAIEGKTFGPLNCTADCFPLCSYKWRFGSNSGHSYKTIENSGVLKINVIKRNNGGFYKCVAENTKLDKKKKKMVFINVHYGPKNTRILLARNTSAGSVIKKDRGSIIENLYCSADCNPVCHYTWTSDNNNFTRNGQILSLGTATLNKGRRYSCTALNSYGISSSNSVTIVIKEYGIKLQNSIALLKSPFTVVDGSKLRLECQAKCRMSCEYRWYVVKTRQHVHGPYLTFQSIKRTQSGIYQCFDSQERRSVYLQILVQYSPSIVSTHLTRPYRTTNYHNVEIKKGDELKLKCEVDSVPAANITWWKSDNQDILTSVTNMSYLVYSKKESFCEDFGTYTCEAQNGIGETVYSNITVLVRCPPHLTVKKRRKMKSNYKSRLGSNVVFTTEVRCYPPVKARWFYKYNHTADKHLINPTENNISSVDGVFSLHIGHIIEEDYGIYLLELSNEEGNLSFTFALEQSRIMVLAPDDMGSTNTNRSGLGSFIGGVVAGIALLCLVVIALVVILMKKRAKSRKELSTERGGSSTEKSGHFDEDNNHHSDTDEEIRTNECGNMEESSAYNNTAYALNSNSNTQDSDVKVHRKYNYTYAQVQKSRKTGGPDEFNFEVYGNNSNKNLKVQKQTITEKLLPGSDEQVVENDQELYAKVEKRQTKDKPCTGEQHHGRPTSKQQREGGKISKKKGADRKSKPKHESQSLNYIEVEFQSPASETSKYIIHGAENRTLYSLVDFTKHAEPLPESEIQDDNGDEPKFKTTEECSEC